MPTKKTKTPRGFREGDRVTIPAHADKPTGTVVQAGPRRFLRVKWDDDGQITALADTDVERYEPAGAELRPIVPEGK